MRMSEEEQFALNTKAFEKPELLDLWQERPGTTTAIILEATEEGVFYFKRIAWSYLNKFLSEFSPSDAPDEELLECIHFRPRSSFESLVKYDANSKFFADVTRVQQNDTYVEKLLEGYRSFKACNESLFQDMKAAAVHSKIIEELTSVFGGDEHITPSPQYMQKPLFDIKKIEVYSVGVINRCLKSGDFIHDRGRKCYNVFLMDIFLGDQPTKILSNFYKRHGWSGGIVTRITEKNKFRGTSVDLFY